MRGLFERFSGRQEYRLVSVVLVAGCVLASYLPLITRLSGGWAALAFATAMSFYVALAALTYFRLRNASLSSWWLLPMIFVFHVGPRWELGSWEWGSSSFEPSGLISLVPIVIGWFATARNSDEPATTEAQS